MQLVEISKGELPPLQQILSVATSLQLLSPSVKVRLPTRPCLLCSCMPSSAHVLMEPMCCPCCSLAASLAS